MFRHKPYGLLGARIEYRDDDGWSAALVGRNLPDEYYAITGADLRSIGWADRVLGEPRFIGMELSKRWGGG